MNCTLKNPGALDYFFGKNYEQLLQLKLFIQSHTMKIIFLTCLLLITGIVSRSQILKKVLNDAKNETEWKVRSKARQKTDAAIDSLLSPPQKSEEKKSRSKQSPAGQS